MVGARSHFWDRSFWTSFKLAVFKDRERDASVGEVCKIDADITFDGLWVNRVGEMPSLLALDHVDVFGCVEISTAWSGRISGLDTALTPEVGLADVMIIRDRNGWTVPHNITELHAKLKPARGVLSVVVSLVAREEEKVGILRDEILNDKRSRSGSAG